MFLRSLSPEDLAYQQEHIHDNLQANVITGTAICLCAAVTSVVLRLTSRWASRSPLGKDDFTIMAALATGTGLSVMTMVLTTFGLGKHQIAQKPSQEATFGKMMIAARTLALISIFITKLSILFLYHRIFSSRKFARILIGVGTFTAAFSVAVALSNIFACRPFKALWDPDTNGNCLNLKALLRAVSVQDVLTDVVILCLPLPMVWRLKMSRNIKWQVTGMFLIGSLVCVGGIVRTVYATRISMKDATWENALPAMWATIEGNLAIVSACLPTYRPLIRYVFGKSANDTTTGANSHSNVGSHYASRNFVKMTDFSDRQRSNTESTEQIIEGNGTNESTRKIGTNSSEIEIESHAGQRGNSRQAS